MPSIKELRKSLKLSQAAFAKSVDAGVSTIIRYETGKAQPSDKVVARIREVYGVDVSFSPAPEAATAEPAVEAVKAAPAEEAKAKAPAPKAKKPRAKKAAKAEPAESVKAEAAPKAKKPLAKKAPAKKEAKPAAKKPAPKGTEIIIQSPMGGEITTEAVLAKVGAADKVYIRVDENKAYWVRGEEAGSVDLW